MYNKYTYIHTYIYIYIYRERDIPATHAEQRGGAKGQRAYACG